MEHLLPPASLRPIDIPYLGGQEFEAGISHFKPDEVLGNFKSYWDRQGWKRDSETGDLVFENHSPQQIVQSLQTWLYFGTLITIFGRVEIPVRTRDFLDTPPTEREIFVRTTHLPDLIAEWGRREGFCDGPPDTNINSRKFMCSENIRETLNWTFYHMNEIFHPQMKAMTEPHKRHMQLVELSIMAIAESISSVVAAVYSYDIKGMPTWGPSPILKARLLDNNWCISDSPFFPESMTQAAISTDYYFGSYMCPRPRGDHAKCTADICNDYCKKITPTEYQQLHVSQNCSCDPIEVPDEAIRFVEQGQIPVLQWDGKRVKVSPSSTQKYVAMSHVWSDGIGNDDKANSLWTCQMTRIQSLVNDLYPQPGTSREDLPFWIDTLCVPVGEKNRHPGGDKTRDLRKEAISQMADVYHLADRVLVLDSFILTLPRSADVVEKYLRIHLSTWHHRLWTMQEGQLAQRLYFQFSDGAESLNDINSTELQKLDRRAPQTLCSPVRQLCAVELQAFYREVELGVGARHDIVTRMRSCARYLRSRETSRAEDESVCVANILGLDASRVLHQKGPDARMACFYDLVAKFDTRIIFHNHPRLQRDGYRWAPRSFLHQLPDIIDNLRDGGLSPEPVKHVTIIPDGGGLPVQFGGFEFNSNSLLQPGSKTWIKPITEGWSWTPKRRGDSSRRLWFECTFKMEIQGKVEDAPPSRAGQRWAVILPGYLHTAYLPVWGVMGVIDADVAQRKRTSWFSCGKNRDSVPDYSVPYKIPVQPICRVRVSMPAQETVPSDVSAIPVLAYGAQQEWCLS